MIEHLVSEWNGESLVLSYDKITGAWIIIAMHSTLLGPATGGTRMKNYPDLESAVLDALRLSAGMTYKFAVPGLNRGGGKAVISIPDDFNAEVRPPLLRRYGSLVKKLGGLFYTGPDVGTSTADMDIIAENGAPYIFCRSIAAGGSGDPGPYTALGVSTAIQVAWEHLTKSSTLKGCRVLVQGVGSVGGRVIDHLCSAEAEVLFSEINEEAIHHFSVDRDLEYIIPDDVYRANCDIYAPCALGGVLNKRTIPQLKCRAVVGGANNQLADPGDAESLLSRGILYAPDYVVNVGGALAATGIEMSGWSPEEAQKQVVHSVRSTLLRIFKISAEETITTEAAASRQAQKNLAKSSE